MSDKLVRLDAALNEIHACEYLEGVTADGRSKMAIGYYEAIERIRTIQPVPRPMSAVEYLKTTRRMCNHYECCVRCPIFGFACVACDIGDAEIETAIAIAEKWAREHPERGEDDETN